MQRLTELLTQPARICQNLPSLPVWHCSVHNHPDDPVLSDQQWEHIATTRRHREEVPRHQLRLVRTAADTAGHEHDFLQRLRASGLLVRPRTSTTSPNQLSRYAVALPDDRNAAGDTIWYSGTSLAADLTLPKLRRRWRFA